MAAADVSIALRASDGDDARVVVHDSHVANDPIASIRLLSSTTVHAGIQTAFDATPADLSAVLRRLADRVDEAHATWKASNDAADTPEGEPPS